MSGWDAKRSALAGHGGGRRRSVSRRRRPSSARHRRRLHLLRRQSRRQGARPRRFGRAPERLQRRLAQDRRRRHRDGTGTPDRALADSRRQPRSARSSAIHVDRADTSVVPDSGPSVASRTTLMTGNAVIDAAGKLKDGHGRRRRGHTGDRRGRGRVRERHRGLSGGTRCRSRSSRRRCWARNVNTAVDGWYAAPESTFDENGQGDAYAVYSYATHVAEVEVDERDRSGDRREDDGRARRRPRAEPGHARGTDRGRRDSRASGWRSSSI